MPEETSDLDSVEFETPIAVPVRQLDASYLGYVLVDPLGVRGGGRPPLVAGNVPLSEAIIDSIRTNSERLGPDQRPLTHVRLRQRADTAVAQQQEVAPLEDRIAIFEGLSASFDAMQQRFAEAVGDVGDLIRSSEEAAVEKLRKVDIQIDPGFRQTLESVLHAILSDPNRATLFACLEQYDGGTFDHSLRVFLMGSKLLAKGLNIPPGKFRENRRMINCAFGMLYHDTGMLLVPQTIREKVLRIPEEEVAQIRKAVFSTGTHPSCLSTIMAVNDPRYVYKPLIEARLKQEVLALEPLVDEGILTQEQFASLKQFPERSCLGATERIVLQRHPLWGWEIVHGSGFCGPQGLDIVRHHHQRLDMTGYPDLQNEMSLQAQVAAAVDVFDALVSERPYTQVKPYDVAFGILDTMTSTDGGHKPLLHRKVFDLLCVCVEKYPIGSFVRVVGGDNDGCIGQVIDYSAYNMNRPSIVLFRDKAGRRIQSSQRIGRKSYDGSFHIRGLPFTDAVMNEVLQDPPHA